MNTIWKFEVPILDEFTLRMPEGAKVLSVGEQWGTLVLWALVDPTAECVDKRFAVRGTGHPTHDLSAEDYIGTAITGGGSLVWHVFGVMDP